MTNCDACVNYEYDEDYECYCCMVNLDEDEMVSLLDYSRYYDKLEMPIPRNRDRVCPYFRLDDEYAVVRHQM